MKLPIFVVLTILLAAALPIESISSTRSNPGDEDLSGTYQCEGKMPNGSAYRGTVHIVRHNGTYQVLWTLGPRERYLGIGIVSDKVLAVSYFTGMPGLVVYRVEQTSQGPRLVGQWTAPEANGRVFVETLTRLTRGVTMPRAPEPTPRRTVAIPWFALRAV